MPDNLVRVLFKLNPDDWHNTPGEGLWAKPLSVTGEVAVLELDNSPFFAKGVSYRDVIRAIDRDGQYEFIDVVAHNGHSTYRLATDKENSIFDEWWSKLRELGCTCEKGTCRGMKLIAVDIPPNTDIYAAYSIIEEGHRQQVWLFDEGHVGHPIEGERRSGH